MVSTGNRLTLSSIHHTTHTDQEMNKLGFSKICYTEHTICFQKRPDIAHDDFQWKINNDGRKKDLIYKIPCNDCMLCYIGDTAQLQWYDEREKQMLA